MGNINLIYKLSYHEIQYVLYLVKIISKNIRIQYLEIYFY